MAENCNFVWSLDHKPKTKPANSVKKNKIILDLHIPVCMQISDKYMYYDIVDDTHLHASI